MDPIEKLLELYKQTQAPSERSVLLETVRISSPDGFSRLEERILKEQVRGMTMEELVHVIAAHRDLSLEQAEELLRDTIFQNLLDRCIQVFCIQGLNKIVAGAKLHRPNNRRNLVHAGKNYGRNAAAKLLQFSQDLETAHSRHPNVEKQHRRGWLGGRETAQDLFS